MAKPNKVEDPAADATRGRKDKRRQVLLYMKDDLIKRLKAAANEEDTTAFRLNEKAVEAFLDARDDHKKKQKRTVKDSKA